MGIFKNFISKIKNAFAKNKKKPYSLCSVNLNNDITSIVTNKESGNLELVGGNTGKIKKQADYELFATAHFAENFADKSLSDVLAFVKDLKNFDDTTIYHGAVATANRQREQASQSALPITLEDLDGYFIYAGDQKLTKEQEEKRNALLSIVSLSEAKARALAYIKSNFVGICNMRDLLGEDNKNSNDKFEKLMAVINDYCDIDINGYSIADFDSQVINDFVLNSKDVYLKGSYYAQKRCDQVLASRMKNEHEISVELSNLANETVRQINDYDENLDKICQLKAEINVLEKAIDDGNTLNKIIKTCLSDSEEKVDEQKLKTLWIKNKPDIEKQGFARQEELIEELYKVARDYGIFDYDEENGSFNFFNYQEKVSLDSDISKMTEKDCDIFDKTLSPYESFAKAIYVYSKDDEIDHKSDIFRVKTNITMVDGKKERVSFIYTNRQEVVLKKIYNELAEYAQNSIKNEDFKDGSNPLLGYAYANSKHSIPDVTLKNIANVLFGKLTQNQQIEANYDKLSTKQLKSLNEFIYVSEPVKNFLKQNNLLTGYEIDRQLLEFFDPEVTDEDENKLEVVMNAMQKEAEDNASTRLEIINKALANEKVACQDEKQQCFKNANQNITRIVNVGDIISLRLPEKVSPRNEEGRLDNKKSENLKELKYQLTKHIVTALDIEDLPQTADEVDQNTKRIGMVKLTNDETVLVRLNSLISKIDENSYDIASDIAGYSKVKDNLERTAYYKKYFTQSDKNKITKFTSQIEEVVANINKARLAKTKTNEEKIAATKTVEAEKAGTDIEK